MHKTHAKRIGRARRLLAVLLLASALLAGQARAGAVEPRRKVRVGYYIAPGFQEYDASTDSYSGSSYEYLIALRQYANWDYEFIPVEFSDGVQMLENGELDLMNNVSKTAERESLLGFSDYASGANYGCLIVDVDNPDYAYNDFEAYGSMRVGIVEKSIFKPYFEAFCTEHAVHPQIFEYKENADMIAALAAGEIDARVVSSSYRDGSRVIARFAPMDFYFAVPKAETALLKELNAAMIAIETDMPNYAATLEKRYERRVVETNVVLSAAEKAYIAAHPSVTVAVSGAWYPIFYFDQNGNPAGPLAEIYARIGRATGLHFEPVRYASYADSLNAVKAGEVDMIVEFAYDFIYADEWEVQLSDRVNDIAFYRVIHENNHSDEVHTIAFYGEPYLEEQVRKKYGTGVEYLNYADVEQAVNAVLSGEADCTFVNYYTSTRFQNKGGYIALKYILIPSLEYDFGLGISNSADPQLKSLVGKGLRTIDSDTMENLFQDSARIERSPDMLAQFYQHPTPFLIALSVLAAALVLSISSFIYSRRMRKKNAELESARRAQSTFLSRMSHDMRTPMNGVLGLAELSENEQDVGALHENMRRIRESGRYLLSLINDTLDFQRIESGKMELERHVAGARRVLDDIIAVIRPAMEKKKLQFDLVNEGADLDSYLMIDEVRFKQIFINLLSNAVKFTPEGGTVQLALGCSGREGMISHAWLRVSDTGIGMSEAYLRSDIFKPFSQESSEVSPQYAGSGLGLSIVKKLVELMQGQIVVESTPGEGTSFTVSFDFERVDREKAEALLRQTQKHTSGVLEQIAGRRILLVEDHPLNAEIARRLLVKAGCRVEHAENGRLAVDAVQRAGNGAYDAILMDIRMPVMNGLEATRQIRSLSLPYAAQVPILAMTANAFESDIRDCLAAGMNAHISKPIDPNTLYRTLAEALSA